MPCVDSTNLVAATLPAWHAVRADTQTCGRGRFQRRWVSDDGGLWISAVIPMPVHSVGLPLLPLASGLAVCQALIDLGVKQIRLRWPNDVLVGNRKLAGLLIDHFQTGRAVVGIGINVRNRPEALDPTLDGCVVSLADLLDDPPTLRDLALHVLGSLKQTLLPLLETGPETILPRLNALWDLPRRVQLDLDHTLVSGDFAGVDSNGRLKLQTAGVMQCLEPHNVRLLRDLPS
jgi:BirA family biotin operon repressor/biotin-[acetyl-CoA-carboxylase] ligase